MAKQSGIHQIRGKVGEMSYYQQAGVNAGLVRRINQGLSDRVKTAAEFANTRLNNAEFKTASLVGAAAGHSVIPAWRSMFRRFAQASMVKRIQELIKQDTTHQWGLRQPIGNMGRVAAELLENYAKAGQYQGQYGQATFTPTYDQDGQLSTIQFTLNGSEETAANLVAQGITGINVYSVGAAMFTTVQDDAVRVAASHSASSLASGDVEIGTDYIISPNPIAVQPAGIGFSPRGYQELLESSNGGVWAVMSIVPTRKVGNTTYELQELATYVVAGYALLQTN